MALLEFLPVHRRLPYIAWSIIWGTRRSPGLAVAAGLVGKHGLLAPRAFAGALEGRASGVRSSRRSRTSRVGIGATPPHIVRRMHAPKLRNVRGVAIELRAGLAALSGWRGKARWAADIFLHRAPAGLQGRHRAALRTIRLKSGVRLRYRLNAGDLQSLREVWLNETYRFPENVGTAETVVDLGANIGLTSVYLARRHGARRLVAVEPVPANAEIARQNLALNGIDGDVIEAAIAAKDGIAYFEDADASNAGQVADNGRPTRAISIATVLADLDTDVVDLLKVDIEGAEEQLFSGDLTWLQSVRMLLVEFHPAIVDYPRLVGVLEDAGFRHIPAGSVYAHTATAFIRPVGGVV